MPSYLFSIQILHVLGVCDVNSVRIHVSRDVPRCGFGPMLPGHALYPMTALLSHSCVANSKTIVRENYSCEVRATAFIPKGEEITKQYVNPLEPTNLRYVACVTFCLGRVQFFKGAAFPGQISKLA